MYVCYDGAWLGISDATGPKGDKGDRGPKGETGSRGPAPGLQDPDPAAITASLDSGLDAKCRCHTMINGDLPISLLTYLKVKKVNDGDPGNLGQIGDTPPADPNAWRSLV